MESSPPSYGRRSTIRTRLDERWQALLAEAGFTLEACYGMFDWSANDGGEDSVWIARK